MSNEPRPSGSHDKFSVEATGAAVTRGTILLVEDEANVRTLVARVLEGQAYTVIEASNGAEALERGLGYSMPIHLLITDVSMPLVNGPELICQLLPRRPNMKVLLITGRDKKDVVNHPVISFLEKPFTLKGLLARVDELLK